MILKKTIINGKDVYEPISYEDALVYNNKDTSKIQTSIFYLLK